MNIIDSAGGIPEDILNNIFKLNFTTKENGTGVGLYLSTKIIEKVGGSLSAANYGEGSKFVLVLPLSLDPISV